MSASDLLVGQVDAGGRLVEEEKIGLAGERAGDQHALLLAARKGADRVVAALGEPDDLERRRGSPRGPCGSRGRSSLRRVSRPAATTSQTEAGTPAAAVARCGTKPMRNHSSYDGQRGVEQADLSGHERPEPDQRADQGGLAGPVGAHERDELAGPDGEVDPAQHGPAAEGDRPVADRDSRRSGGHRHPLAVCSAVRFDSHEGEVVLAGGRVGQALDRVEDAVGETEVGGDALAERGLQRLAEHRGDALLLDQLLQLPEDGCRRLGVGGEPDDRGDVQAVLLEIAERVVRHDDGVTLAVGEASGVGRVEGLELLAQGRRVRRVGLRVVLVEGRELARDGVGDVGDPDRVLPEVGVEAAVVVLVLVLLLACVLLVLLRRLLHGHQVGEPGDVEGVALRVLRDGVVDGRLEAGLVDDEVGVGDLGGLVATSSSRSWGSEPGVVSSSTSVSVPSATCSVSQARG